MKRIIIENGLLYDGTPSPPMQANILIEAGLVKQISACKQKRRRSRSCFN